MATIEMSLTEYQALINEREEARREAAQLRADIIAVRMEDPADTIKMLTLAYRDALDLVRHSVANIPPETKSWLKLCPALVMAANTVEVLPDHTSDDQDLAITLRGFVDEIKEHAEARGERTLAASTPAAPATTNGTPAPAP